MGRLALLWVPILLALTHLWNSAPFVISTQNLTEDFGHLGNVSGEWMGFLLML